MNLTVLLKMFQQIGEYDKKRTLVVLNDTCFNNV